MSDERAVIKGNLKNSVVSGNKITGVSTILDGDAEGSAIKGNTVDAAPKEKSFWRKLIEAGAIKIILGVAAFIGAAILGIWTQF